MGIDPAQLSSGISTISSEATDPNPTLESLTVTGATVLDDVTVGGALVATLPTVDPLADDQLWADTDVVTVSAGTPP